MDTKVCVVCKQSFPRPCTKTDRGWEMTKYCSKACATKVYTATRRKHGKRSV